MSVLSKMIYRFSEIPIKIPASYFMDFEKLTLKFVWRVKRPRIFNKIFKEKNKVRRWKLPNFKIYYKSSVLKTA